MSQKKDNFILGFSESILCFEKVFSSTQMSQMQSTNFAYRTFRTLQNTVWKTKHCGSYNSLGLFTTPNYATSTGCLLC